MRTTADNKLCLNALALGGGPGQPKQESANMKMRESEKMRARLESRIINLCNSRHLKNKIMANVDELVLQTLAEKMGLSDNDIVAACKEADETF